MLYYFSPEALISCDFNDNMTSLGYSMLKGRYDDFMMDAFPDMDYPPLSKEDMNANVNEYVSTPDGKEEVRLAKEGYKFLVDIGYPVKGHDYGVEGFLFEKEIFDFPVSLGGGNLFDDTEDTRNLLLFLGDIASYREYE